MMLSGQGAFLGLRPFQTPDQQIDADSDGVTWGQAADGVVIDDLTKTWRERKVRKIHTAVKKSIYRAITPARH